MNAIISRAILLFLFLVFPVFLSGQIPSGQFISGEYRFTIGLPAKPTERTTANTEILKYAVFGEYIRWNDVAGTFVSLEAYDVSGDNPQLTAPEKVKVIAEYRKANIAEFKTLDFMIQDAPFAFGAIKGTEVRGIRTTAKLIVRMFFVKDRLFVISASKSSAPDFNWHLEVLNSFRILTKEEYVAAKIDESTPDALPQTPHPDRPANDLAAENLKGKVRSIIEDEQESQKAPRERSREVHYDLDGNLVRQIEYSSGYPVNVTIWGWIDGMRVSAFNFISYPFGEGPNEERITSIIEMVSPRDPGIEKKERDRRYTTRDEVKYDGQNRIVEKRQFGNDGELMGTENRTYGLNTLTTEYNDDGGKTRRVVTLDPNGHVIEEIFFGPKSKIEYSYSYKYELDAKGNWITRHMAEKKTVKGKTRVIPRPVKFRSISYN
jgi:hypothetical protein